jgi:putative ATP-binding cassette transporter
MLLYLYRCRIAVPAAVVLGLVSGLTTTLLLALINSVLAAHQWTWGVVAAFAGLCLLRLVTGVAAHIILIAQSQRAVCDLRLDLCDRVLRAPLAQLEALGEHRLTACFADDIAQVAQVVVNVPYAFVNLVILAGCLAYLGWMSSVVLGGVLLCLLGGALTYLGPVLWATRHLRRAREHQDTLFKNYYAVVGGVKELKLNDARRAAFVAGALRPSADDVRRHSVSGITVYATAANWNRLLFFVYVGLLLFAFPSLAPLEPARLAGYVVVLLYMMAPLEAIMNTLPHFARAEVALSRIRQLAEQLSTQRPVSHAEAIASDVRTIELRRVAYQYPSDGETGSFRLGPLDLTLGRGETVFLTGGNGSGKTTLVKLLTGLYEPSAGALIVNRRAVDAALAAAYRQLFSVVFTEFHLFERLDGISLGRDVGRVQALLELLQLDGRVEVVDGRLSTLNLSRGQRKRLAMLVALLEDRPFYVFDEWAADQEPAFRETFYRHIIPSLRDAGKGVLVVTHDDRYYELADRIVHLECGLLEHGPQPSARGRVEAAAPIECSSGAPCEPS